MTETPLQPASPRLRPALLPGLLIGAIIALLLAVLMARVQSGPLAALWSLLSGRNTRITSEGSVIERIQRLQRMETVVFNMDKIVTGEKDNPILPDFIAGDRLLMIVHGQVVAGIDFSRLKNSDIKIQGKDSTHPPAESSDSDHPAGQRAHQSLFTQHWTSGPR